jgi:hypothetical protein
MQQDLSSRGHNEGTAARFPPHPKRSQNSMEPELVGKRLSPYASTPPLAHRTNTCPCVPATLSMHPLL